MSKSQRAGSAALLPGADTVQPRVGETAWLILELKTFL